MCLRTLFVGLRSPTTTSGLMVDSSLQMFKRGEAERLTELLGCCLGHSGVAKSESTFLCDLPMWIFKPFSDLKLFSHWSHLKTFFTVSSLEARVTRSPSGLPAFRMYDTNIPIHYSKLKHHICVTFAVIIGRPTIYVFQFLECLKITLKSQFRQFEFNTLNP